MAARKKSPAKKAPAARKAVTPKKTVPAKKAAKPSKTAAAPDLSALPAEAVKSFERRVCLACVMSVFTRHLGLSPQTAYREMRKYTPSVEELSRDEVGRPYFAAGPEECPYCGAGLKWLASFQVHRVESGKAADTARREIVKSLPETRFTVLEEKSTRQAAFYEWLDSVSGSLDLDDPQWLMAVSRHYLSRKEPKSDWSAIWTGVGSIRRSRRLETGWEVDGGRLFLAPLLFDELLLVQYLVSRSHKAGGLTLEGRYTLPELFGRLRNSHYLQGVGVSAHNPSDTLEELLAYLSGGEAAMRFYYIVDKGPYLERLKEVQDTRPPRAKPVSAGTTR